MTQKGSGCIGILTGGGDCPGINAVIRAVSKTAMVKYGLEVVGFLDGFWGLIHNQRRVLSYDDVSGVLTLGGTILGTSNRANPFREAREGPDGLIFEDVSDRTMEHFNRNELQALIVIGGDGSLSIAQGLFEKGMPVVGVPKTIDNDLSETDVTFGFATAVANAAEAIDKIHTTAQSHHRVMLVETMGRYAGWIALAAGVASGGDVILIPEIPYDLDVIARRVQERSRRGKRFSIVVVAEGAKPRGGEVVVDRVVEESTDPWRLGGVGRKLAMDLEKTTGLECRVTVLGHVQRGGSPVAADRILATQFGCTAADLAVAGDFGKMVALRGSRVVSVDIARAVARQKLVPPDHPLIVTNKAIGVCFGDE
jgi:phosphofructokinase-like protein